jgi:hypothetical protein
MLNLQSMCMHHTLAQEDRYEHGTMCDFEVGWAHNLEVWLC